MEAWKKKNILLPPLPTSEPLLCPRGSPSEFIKCDVYLFGCLGIVKHGITRDRLSRKEGGCLVWENGCQGGLWFWPACPAFVGDYHGTILLHDC